MAFNISYVYEVVDKASRKLDKIKKKQLVLARAMNIAAVRVEKSHKHMVKAQKRALEQMQKQAVKAAVVLGSAYVLALPIRRAIEFESAMADVAKVVDFTEPDGLKKMASSIKSLSAKLPVTQEGLAAIVAMGGQLGVPAEKLTQFAETAAKMSVAFDILPKEAAEAMGIMSRSMGIPIERIGELGDLINEVSNNAGASAAQLTTALTRGGAVAIRVLGLTKEQSVGMAASFIEAGLSAEQTGTRMRIMVRSLGNAEKTTKALGIGFTNLVKKNPQEAIIKLLQAVNAGKIPQEKLNFLLGETVTDFQLLAQNVKRYERNLALANNTVGVAGSMQAEFANRAATTDNQMILLKNSMSNIAINIGTVFLPAVNSVTKAVASMANGIAIFAETFPNLTKGLGAIAIAILLVKSATIAWKVAQIALNMAVLANPIGLIVVAIASAVALVIAFSSEINRFVSELLGMEDIARSIGDLLGFGSLEAPEIKAPGAQEVTGQMGVNINLAGNTDAVESVSARQTGGNLGMNMAVAQ